MFLEDYLKTNNIKPNSYKSGYLPLLMVFNRNSQSTPCRMVQCPNRQAVCKPSKNTMVQGEKNETISGKVAQSDTIINSSNCKDPTPNKPKLLSYNDCIKSYDLTLLTPNKITVNHLLTILPIFADVSDAFGHILCTLTQLYLIKFSYIRVLRIQSQL